VGFRNRFLVFLNWTWNYFSYNSSIRLIVGKKQENVPVEAVTAKTEVGIGPRTAADRHKKGVFGIGY
jgi:hypothetical protein